MLQKISPRPSLPKRGNSSLLQKGGKEGFSLRCPYNYGLINNRSAGVKQLQKYSYYDNFNFDKDCYDKFDSE
jgi:hypothetical protein